MAFDTTRFLTQLNQTGCLPTGRFTDAELLAIGYDVLLSELVPLIIKIREEYYVKLYDSNITVSQAAYPIVSRSIGGTLREVKMIVGTDILNLLRVDLEDIKFVQVGTPDRFYVMGNDLNLFPTPSATANTLRQIYYIRPSKLVPVSETAVITAINTATKTVTITIPTGWTTANTFDLVRGSAHYDVLDLNLVATSVGAGVIIFTNTLPTSLAVGDYVTLADESCFPYLPPEGHTVLVQATAAAALETIGDPAAANVAAKALMLKENLKSVLSVRIQGAPKRLGVRVL